MTNQATMTVKKDKKGNPTSVEFANVMLFYVKMDKAVAVYDERKMSKPNNTEYTIDIAVTEEIADEWDELFPKQPAKKVLNKKFREQFRLEEEDPLPVPDAKKQFIVKLKQKAKNADGTMRTGKARPRVFNAPEGEKPTDITFKTKVANGSVGGVLVRAAYNDRIEACLAYLSAVKVTTLIEYEADSGMDDFLGGSVDLDEDPDSGGEAAESSGGSDDGEEYGDDDEFGDQPDKDGQDDDEEYD